MSEVIDVVAQRLGLPYWWVESVAIEYTECRDYAVSGKIWAFNWGKLAESELEEAVRTHKVVARDYLIHNVHRDVFPARAANQLAAGALPSIVGSRDDLIPEGLVSQYFLPLQFNDISVVDPKHGFSGWFQVLDNGHFWQWRIAEFVEVEGRNYGKWISQEVDLEPLDQIHEQLIALRQSAMSPGAPGYAEFRFRVEQFYKWLDELRGPILLALQSVHSRKRSAKEDFPKATTGYPPLLSRFETYTVRNHEFYTKFFAEPIFLRGCIQHAKRAEELARSAENERDHVRKLDEIYQERAIAVILGALCVEAFVNGLLSEQFPELWELVESLEVLSKLNLYLKLKNGDELFGIDPGAHQFLKELIDRRNMLVHFKRDYQSLKHYKQKPVTYIGCKLSRELNRDLPDKLVKLVLVVCEAVDVPIPKWVLS